MNDGNQSSGGGTLCFGEIVRKTACLTKDQMIFYWKIYEFVKSYRFRQLQTAPAAGIPGTGP